MAIDKTNLKKRMFSLGASDLPKLTRIKSSHVVMKEPCNCGGIDCLRLEQEYYFEGVYEVFLGLVDDLINDINIEEQINDFNPYTYYGDKVEPLIVDALNEKLGVLGKEKNGVKYPNYIFPDNFAISHDWFIEKPIEIVVGDEKHEISTAEIKTTTNKNKDIDLTKYYYQTQAQLHFEGNETQLLVVYERPNIAHWDETEIDELISKFDKSKITYFLVKYDKEHFNEFVMKRMNPFIQFMIDYKNGSHPTKEQVEEKMKEKIEKTRKIKKSYIKIEI